MGGIIGLFERQEQLRSVGPTSRPIVG